VKQVLICFKFPLVGMFRTKIRAILQKDFVCRQLQVLRDGVNGVKVVA
jgi:hypothetical protein